MDVRSLFLTAVRVKFVGDALLALGWRFLALGRRMVGDGLLPDVPLPSLSSSRRSMLRPMGAVLPFVGSLRDAIGFGAQ